MNKKHVMYTAVSSVLLSSSLLLHSIDADAAESAKITATSLNVRATPSTSGAIVGKITKGNTVDIVDESKGWAKITYNGKEAWISSQYINKTKTNSTSTANSTSKSAVVNASSLNVRSSASTSASIVTNLSRNSKVTVVKVSGSWSQIKTASGQTGWVASQYLKADSSSSVPAKDSSSTTAKSAVVNASSLNVRSSASTSASVVTNLPRNSKVTVVKESGSWSQIKTASGQMGWVASQYLQAGSASSTPAKDSGSTTSKSAVVNASSLNVRSSASTSASVVTNLPRNSKVTVVKESGSWSQIKTASGQTGWVASQYLQAGSASSAPAKDSESTTTTSKSAVVNASSLNVRSSASTSASIVTNLPRNSKVTVVKESGSWSQVKTASGQTGWVASQYLQADSGQSSQPAQSIQITKAANLRSQPSLSAGIIRVSKAGETFEKVGEANDWVQIQYSGSQTAWVSKGLTAAPGSTTPDNLQSPSDTLKDKIIVVDAGHGGYDPGTSGGSSIEKNLALTTAKLVASRLANAGANVFMTRSNDTFISLSGRVDVSEAKHADAFISIHYNSSTSSSANGVMSFYYNESKDKELAKYIQESMMENVTSMKNQGVRFGNYYVLRENNQRAVLLELGFLSNAHDEQIVSSNAYQQQISTGIYQGIARYFAANK
ncbi:SH3 domain-containing protein [Priestia aryabhattai]|uniref:SH3 domain-containing protein n=1 Tax=Priestia aryabhattai TaxID=412384 RepID=A0ABD7WPW3_PRIAR|nr:SH3 domain-containing protein [Priestia aryabhattai]WEA42339.1 SH3 domain-containing protein [Priestia aryabhattai]